MKKILTGLCAMLMTVCAFAAESMGKDFRAVNGQYLLDGKPFLVRAGELHYTRIPKEYWDHRIKMTKALGMNTICIYLFWNFHEQEQDKFDFTGDKDIVEFVKLIQANGMYCILRPGPYVCAEWEMGGIPWWLLKKDDLAVRTFRDSLYKERTQKYLKEVGKRLAPLQIQNGGNIILVQVENEYACFGREQAYMEGMRDTLREAGFDKVQLIRCDWNSNYNNYKLDDVGICLNFGAGSNINSQFGDIKNRYPNNPLMCGEYWTGWYDNFGKPHETRDVNSFIGSLKDMLDRKISFSLYMAHGGTTFGQWGGANSPPYSSMVSSYDYNAPITEAGWTTDKFDAVRNLLKNYLNEGETLAPVPEKNPVITIPEFKLMLAAPLFSNLPAANVSEKIQPMEKFNQGFGRILYRTTLPREASGQTLTISEVHDWAAVYINGELIGTADRRFDVNGSIKLPSFESAVTLDILVENMGRVNYAGGIIDRKGITNSVACNGREVTGWKVYSFPVDFEFQRNQKYTPVMNPVNGPAWYRGTFTVDKVGDTFLDVSKFGKGMVWVNGHNLGRYWFIGPQQALYLPGCWLKQGENEVVVLDLLKSEGLTLAGLDQPVIDRLRKDNTQQSIIHRKAGQNLNLAGEKVAAQGEFANTDRWQTIRFNEPVTGRYICLEALGEQTNAGYASCAELVVVDDKGNDVDRTYWKVVYADSEEMEDANNNADKLIDLQESTFWHTQYTGATPRFPHTVVIDMQATKTLSGFKILNRIDGNSNGRIKGYRFYVKKDNFKY